MLQRRPLLILLLALTPAACSDDSAPPQDTGQADQAVKPDASTDAAAPDQTRPDATRTDTYAHDGAIPNLAQLKAGWNLFYTPKPTVCSRGTTYGFGVWKGSANKVVIDFEGGGACWTHTSCSVAGAIFKEDVDKSFQRAKSGYALGIYDKKNTKNPFKDWHHVFVPYCSGDIHWGDTKTTYKDKDGKNAFSIEHRGAVNSGYVMDWVYKNFPAPEKIFVTGCSAGSYGSIMWAGRMAHKYPKAKIYQFGDSGAGVITKSFIKDSFPQWNALPAAPDWIPALDPKKVDLMSKDLAYIYASVANFYQGQRFSQYNTVLDSTQVTYFQFMGGGTAAQWSEQMVQSVDSIIKAAPTFRAFMPDGKKHCIIPYAELYTYEVNGVKLIDWLTDWVNDKAVSNQRCKTCVPKNTSTPDGGSTTSDAGNKTPDAGP